VLFTSSMAELSGAVASVLMATWAFRVVTESINKISIAIAFIISIIKNNYTISWSLPLSTLPVVAGIRKVWSVKTEENTAMQYNIGELAGVVENQKKKQYKELATCLLLIDSHSG
jgi:hypothetical protein